MRNRSLYLALTLALLCVAIAVSSVSAAGRRFELTLTSAEEIPQPAAGISAVGSGLLTINPGTGEVCFWYELTSTGTVDMGTVFAAHIHEAPFGVRGDIVVPLELNGCLTSTDRARLIDVLRDPASYYVNVHSTAAQAGIGRDQLSH